MRVYLAGKMDEEHGDWRSAILDGLRSRPRTGTDRDYFGTPYWQIIVRPGNVFGDEVMVTPWPTEPNTAVMGGHEYVGPYRFGFEPELDSKWSGSFNGSVWYVQHGIMDWRAQKVILQQSENAIRRADMVFVWLNADDCYGTLAEIGFARALGKYIHIVYDRIDSPCIQSEDTWFVGKMASSESYAYNDDGPPEREQYSDWSWRSVIIRKHFQDAVFQWLSAVSDGKPHRVTDEMLEKRIVEWQRDDKDGRLREALHSFSQIAHWSADPRVRSEASRMVQHLTDSRLAHER